MKVAILGFGREGQSVLRYILKTDLYAKEDIFILDKNINVKIPSGSPKNLGSNYLKNLPQFNIIFRSPGVPYNLPELQNARSSGVKFSSATKLFFEHFENQKPETRNQKPNIIGITGTKGKGTTATLLYKILTAAGRQARPERRRRVFLAGNIGIPALDILPKLNKKSLVILELSSFQLQDLVVSPPIAAVLDIFPDHQDKHKNFQEYLLAKSNIAAHQKSSDIVFYVSSNRYATAIARKSKGEKISVGEKNSPLFAPEDLKIQGAHNFRNAVMAATIAKFLGAEKHIIIKTAKRFRGLPHRLEFVAKKRGITFVNDSAAVNPMAALAALKAMRGQRLILIAGGKERGLDYRALGAGIRRLVKHTVLYGENKNRLARSIKESSRMTLAENLREAFHRALTAAKAGDIILLSPASASYDMFANFQERGDAFNALVSKLKT